MLDFLFAYGGYTPHGFCLAWDPRVLWTHVASDLLIALSYFSIPAVLLILVRQRRDPALNGVATLFSAFILLCGLTHVMGVITLWAPLYGMQAALKAVTAVVSAITAGLLWSALPTLRKIPSREALVAALSEQSNEIAQRRKAEQAADSSQRVLANKIEELKTANKELSELAYAASHDLKSPLTSLGVLLGMIEEDYGEEIGADGIASVQTAQKLSRRMQSIVDDLSDYSELLTEDRKVTTVDMSELVAEVLQSLDDQIAFLNADVEVGDLPNVIGARTHLQVLVRQLVGNALVYHIAGESPKLVILGEETDEFVRYHFEDHGIGIDPKHREKIFKLFGRLHRDEDIPGTGLGLALCRRVAALHGGTLVVEETEGGGSRFVLTIPKASPSQTMPRRERLRSSRAPFRSNDGPALA